MSKKMMKYYILSIIILIAVTIGNIKVHVNGKNYYNNRIEKNKITPKVYDIGMKYIPDLSNNKQLEFFVNILPMIVPLFFGYDILLKLVKLGIYIYIIRYIFTSLTILPKIKKCDDTKYTWKNMLFGHCYDKIFSGHFAIMMLFILIAHDMNALSNKWLSSIFLIIYAILIIAVRFHYTIDIAIAGIISVLIFTQLKNKV